MADPREAALARIEQLKADERRRLQIEQRGAQVLDFNAYLAGLRAQQPSDAERAAWVRQREALVVVCSKHEADPGSFCTNKTIACEHRLAYFRHTAKKRAEAQRQNERARWIVELERSGVPGEHMKLIRAGSWDRTRETFIAAEAWHNAGTTRGLVFGGDTGRGKSGAAARLCELGPRVGAGVVWIATPRLNFLPLFEPEGGWRLGPRQKHPPITYSDALTAGRVVFDDVGSAVIGDIEKWRERMVDILTARLDNDLEIIMTTNVGAAGEWEPLRDFLAAPQIWARLRAWCTWTGSAGDCLRVKE